MGKRVRPHHHDKKNNVSVQSSSKTVIALICLGLAVAIFAVYWPVLDAGFVNYDDPRYVTENQHVLGGLTFDNIKWAFSTAAYAANWHPLTWLSHMLDCELFGRNAGLHHLTNIIMHTAGSVLLLLVLTFMTGRIWPSTFVAAAFALHPLHVESVAWIAERKDVLSGLFWMLTMACYLRYTRTHSRGSYCLTLVVFGLGLMAKPMLVTLPFVLLLLDYWPLERLKLDLPVNRFQRMRSLVVEKIPFFILLVASCAITYMAQDSGGAVRTIEFAPFGARLSNAMVSYMTYIAKMVWPVGLAVLYPLKQIPLWQSFSAFLLLAIITVAVVLSARRKRYFAIGWFWYIGTLVPVIGLVQVGAQSLADRYTYIPLIGLFIIAAWAVSDFCRNRRSLRLISVIAAMLLIAGMFAGTRKQLSCWTDSIALCRRAVEVTKNNYTMHNNLGNALIEVGQLDEAMDHYRRALQIAPNYVKGCNNLGLALAKAGQLDEAIDYYRHALQIAPDYAEAHNGLAVMLARKGQMDEAIDHYRRALMIDPDNVKANNNLGAALAVIGRFDEALVYLRCALQINPDYAEAHNNMGLALASAGQLAEAIDHYRRALQIDPDYTEAHNNLGLALAKAGQLDEAIDQYRFALQIDPDHAKANSNLGSALAGAGQFDEAAIYFRRILQINPDNVEMHNNLGLALTKSGQLDEAINQYRRALQIDPNNAITHNNLGLALAKTDQLDEAIGHYRDALKINPDYTTARINLADMLSKRDQLDEAITHYLQVLQLQPEHPAAMNNLAWILATAADPVLREPEEAVRMAEKVHDLIGQETVWSLDTLSVAYASAGRFNDAMSTSEKALKLAEAAGNENLEKEIIDRLKLFREGRTYIEKPQVKDKIPDGLR